MVRETRHLWVGNLPENIREDRIREHFKRYGRVQSVKLLPRGSKDSITGTIGCGTTQTEGTLACTIAFMDIKSASKAHTAEHKLDERTLTTEYYEPAAIPSAAAPQTPERTITSTPSSSSASSVGTGVATPGVVGGSTVAPVGAGAYTPSTANSRFPNSHGPAEEHPSFSDRFYERGASRVADPEYLRRPGYHETSRGRARDRLYRNGPYTNTILDRGHRSALGAAWSTYDGTATRYSTTTAAETTYVSTPPVVESVERRSSVDVVQIIKKKTKSRSGSRTPSPSGSTSSRSPSRSRSRSSSSSSSSSTSRGSSTPTSSPRTRLSRVQSSVSTAPPVHSEDRRPLAICVRNLPARSSDTSLKDGLFHEYKKHGKVTWVKVVGQSSDRYALVCFKKPDDVEKALEVSYDKLFFGCKIEVGPYQGYDVEDNEFRPYEAELDEFHPKATRTLFIGNLEKDVSASDLRKHFDQFGEIIEIDIKKQGAVSSYAFCQYSDIVSVVKAIRKMDGEHLGNNRIKLGFGKSMPTNCVWVDGISERVDEKYLTLQFERYGQVTQASLDRDRGHALIFFEQVSCAQTAVKEMRGINIRGKKLQVDFASRECQDTFFDHLEKHGGVGERPVFETTRDATQRERSFETSTLATTNRYARYETPSRPRTSSYSSRSGTGSQCTGSSAVPSPGTPGSVTPRGSGSRSRLTRYAEYYEAAGGVEYPERRFRSYDEFSQGSGASHEDGYEHEYTIYNRESPAHVVDPVETTRTMQSVVVTTDLQTGATTFVPPDIRHLQKERVHLLEQLDECPSSGDELMSPKKRLKLELCDSVTIGNSVDLVELNHTGSDHRKVIEVRRLSDGVKHHSRRPSIDGTKHCVIPAERSYLPHAVCKRRKTSGSESDRPRIHHHNTHDMSGSESLAGSRPGTPLCDERPENLPPSEPRRLPRERNINDGPLSLPLPRFAAQVLNSPRINISVAGFKGSNNIVSSPPAIVTSPKVSNPIPPSPVHVPPPASPPPRPPSSSNSSDSDAAPPSPTLEERLRSLDEKYEKWSGSRALSAAGGDALAKLDASAAERFRFRHKLLDLDIKELQPSEIVKSVLAKRSVFDEDSKRLENVGEKYEPRDFTAFPRTINPPPPTVAVSIPVAVPIIPVTPPATAVPVKCLPGTGIVKPSPVVVVNTSLSPRSTSIPAAKGLQYPFPSHPPVAAAASSATSAASSPVAVAPVLRVPTTGQPIHSDNNARLKLCPSLPSSGDTRTNSNNKVNLINRSISTVSVSSTQQNSGCTTATVAKLTRSLDGKNGDSDKIINNTNIPINLSESVVTTTTTACGTVNNLTPPRDKSASSRKEENHTNKSGENNNNNPKTTTTNKSDKVSSRRDSVSSSPSSSTSSYKSDTSSKKSERRGDSKKSDKDISDNNSDHNRTVIKSKEISECDSEFCDKKSAAAAAEEERIRAERAEKDRQETERRERVEKERLENERLEKERLEKERLEKEKLEKERLEKERIEKERLETERIERERIEKEKLEKEKLEKERLEKERQEKERLEKERLELERQERERVERERKREKEEREKREREERERREEEERIEKEKQQQQHERERKEKEETEKREREEQEKERVEKELLHEKLIKEKHDHHRKRDKENDKHERRHKEDNHEKKKDDHDSSKTRHHNHNHNDTESKNRHRENHVDVAKVSERHRDSHDSRKENKEHESNRTKDLHENIRNNHESQRKESHEKTKEHHENSRNNSELRREEKHHNHNNENSKNRHHTERKEPTKEVREEKNRHFSTDSTNSAKDRHSSTDSRHLSTESDKSRPYNNDHGLNSTPNRLDTKRKDKINNSPASVGCKRRISSQDSSESPDDTKRLKVSVEHKKISDRRDSKDSRDSNNSRSSSDKPKHKTQYKSNFTRMLEDKIREEKRNLTLSDEKRKEKEREERHKLKQAQKAEKQKVKSKNRECSKETKIIDPTTPLTPKSSCPKEIMLDKDFLARLDLRANEEDQKMIHRKENKEKRKSENHDTSDERRNSDDNKRIDERKKEKYIMQEKKNRDENMIKAFEDKNKNPQKLECHLPKPQRIRKMTNSSDNTTDSDEPKKHSIFDIVDDEPAYISMYDKVKARSCKNMQKQEEEKRQEKLKAKFTQLKQSRAKREEKKRSTSWDEDSDSDQMDSGNRDHDDDHVGKQNRRGNKMLITSSSEDENGTKSRKKNDLYTDSDSDRIRQHDRHIDTSDEENARNKSLLRKGSKSRITSDTSEDEQMRKRLEKIKKERYSDSDIDQGFADSDEKPDIKHYKKVKEEKLNHYEEDKYIKKERKTNSKLHISDVDTRKMLTDAVKAEIFGEKDLEIRVDNNKIANNLAMLCDISSEGETTHNEFKKEAFSLDKFEIRKKHHKKKQKRQKNNINSSEDGIIKIERMDETENESKLVDESNEKIKTSEKKKHGSKKDKKRDKTKDEDRMKEKSKKLRKISKDHSKTEHNIKREGKLEDIFGSFSDDSEPGNKDNNILNSITNKDNNSFFHHLSDKLHSSRLYASDSDSGQHLENNEKEKLKEENRKRKEKKRKEKERRLREENENSVDFADMGKLLEDNLKEENTNENSDKLETSVKVKKEIEDEIIVKTEENSDVFKFSDGDESPELEKKETEKKEMKEKKKKRKKSKEEKQNRHHHHHHDKFVEKPEKIKSPDQIKKELLIDTIKEEPEIKPSLQSPSLPSILDIPSPPQVKNVSTDFSISPIAREQPLISPIPKTPTSIKTEKKRDKFIPFGSEIDEKIHENAVKSISDFGSPPLAERIEPEEIKLEVIPKVEKSEVNEDKPRVVISQEETEDAVAALLGESFGAGDFDDCYNESQQSPTNVENQTESTNDEVVQDDEEMRQAVQSLNAADMEVKPDTPQSEHDLQIDTDTDDGEEIVVRYEQSPRTPDMVDLSRPPKTPDFPTNYYRSDADANKTPVLIKPSDIPIKSEEKDIEDVRRNIESSLDQPRNDKLPNTTPESQNRTVISKSWTPKPIETEPKIELQKPEIFVSKHEPVQKPICTQSSIITSQPATSILPPAKSYLPPPVIKISEHPALVSSKPEPKLISSSYANLDLTSKISTSIPPALTTVMSKQVRPVPQQPTLPVRVQHAVISHLPNSTSKSHNSSLLPTVVTSASVPLNRLPITPIMVSKAMQPSTMILPQPKTAVSTIQKLVSSPELIKHEPPRMVYHTTGNMTIPSYSYPHSLTHPQAVPSSPIHLPVRSTAPVGLLTPARHVLPQTTFGIPSTTRSVSPLVKESLKSVIEKPQQILNDHSKISLPGHIYSPHDINKPTSAVIQEVPTPKLVPIPEIRNSQHSIIQQAPPPQQKIVSSVQDIIRSVSQTTQASQLIMSKPITTLHHSMTINHTVIPHATVTQTKISHSMPSLTSEPTFITTSPIVSVPKLQNSQPVITKPPLVPKPFVSQPSTIIISQPSMITQPNIITQSVSSILVKSPTITTPKPIITEPPLMPPKLENHCPILQNELNEHPRVIKEPIRSSTPSPVIVNPIHSPKEQTQKIEPLIKVELPVKPEPKTNEVQEKEEPEKLVIVKEEINPEPIIIKEENITELNEEIKLEKEPEIKLEPKEPVSVIKETENYDKKKQEETLVVVSEPNEILSSETIKDDPLDSKEDSDYWSAKEVNIESVIKKVDALCSADEMSEGSEVCKEEWYDHESKLNNTSPKIDEPFEKELEKPEDIEVDQIKTDDIENETESLDINHDEGKEVSGRGRRGGRARGRKPTKATERTTGVTTRRGNKTPTTSRRGGRGGRTRIDKKSKTSESDVYEFHDDSDESKDRPRLILTIKSPAGCGNTPSTPSATIKEAPVAQKAAHIKEMHPAPKAPEDFLSPAANTRKSRRIQERDGSRNTVDDIIEDVVRNVAIVTRSASAAASPRRSTRQNVKLPPIVEPRKSPRAAKKKDRRVSDCTDDSSEEKSVKKDEIKLDNIPLVVNKEDIPKLEPKLPEKEKPKEMMPMGLKATVLRRLKGEMNEEPMTLIDPVTGLLTQMRECEEGKYIPVSTSSSVIIGNNAGPSLDTKINNPKPLPCKPTTSIPTIESVTTTVITKPPPTQQPATIHSTKPHTLKSHVLSSQAAKVVVNQPPVAKTAMVQSVQQPIFITKQTIPVTQNLNVNVSLAPTMTDNLSPRQQQNVPPKPVHVLPQSPMSPNQPISNPKQHFLQAVQKTLVQQPQIKPIMTTAVNPKTHLLNAVNQNILTTNAMQNATLVHMGKTQQQHPMPQPTALPSPVKQQQQQVVIGNIAPIVKPHNLHVPQQILTGAVASPPLKHHLAQQPIVAGASSGRIAIPGASPMPGISAKGTLDPQKVEVSMAGCVMISHPTVSPQAQARSQVLQAGMPVPAYEASLHGVGDHPLFSRQSPPPAHQQTSPAPQGEPMAHFPPGSVPLRNPHDVAPQYFMHSHSVYQQYLRSQQETRIPYHLPRSPMVSGGLQKTKDGQEGEEAPVTSPPLELRRPGSVGLTARPTAVPHSLQSPHDRATDSPQVAQVYMHQARMPHYHTPGRYYESTEPPPAHRPVTSHTALTGPGPSLGAAGNLTGAMARHTGAEAPTSQRGLQVATPPHASQVPPQADSLLSLLKQYQIKWQGLLALKNDQAAVQMHFVFGNPDVARNSLPCNSDGTTPPLRIAQRMRLEKTQVEGVARKMQMENEHCVLLALPCGRDHMDVLQQSTNLSNGFITYLQQKEAAGIVNIAAPGSQHPAYVVHIFPSCDFVKENLARIAPNLLHRVADIAHLLIVIATV